MAFVDDDVAEILRRVVLDEETGAVLVRVNAQCLVGRHQDARVLLRVVAAHRRGVAAEHVLKCGQPLRAQLVAVAHEQRPPQLARIGNALEQVHRDKGLA